MLTPLLLTLPWAALGAWMAFGIRLPPPLAGMAPIPDRGGGRRGVGTPPRPGGEADVDPPELTVIVPARNEERNLGRCLAGLTSQDHPGFEVVVVDDRSEDGTGRIARATPHGRASALRVVEGREPPPGWLGKPWACRQGAEAARGRLLLFLDADTRLRPTLLRSAVAALEEEGAEALTLLGRQILDSFWEKVLQPHFFVLLGIRYPFLHRPVGPGRCRHAIANGQFILIRREAYERFGGHDAVRGEVVEDMRLAQVLCRSGGTLAFRRTDDLFATRMYASFREVVDGWTKNVAVGAGQSLGVGGAAAALAPGGIVAHQLLFWVLPPTLLLLWGLGVLALPGGIALWAALATALGVLLWTGACHRFHVSPLYGLTFPLGALVSAGVVARSWLRGSAVEWKGRRYRLDSIERDREPEERR